MALFARKPPAVPEQPVAEQHVTLGSEAIDAFQDAVLAEASPLAPFGMQLHDVQGLVLCEDIAAELDIPLVSLARVAGYGVRAADLAGASETAPATLVLVAVVDDAMAPPLVEGACVLVRPGSPLPAHADAVVPLEDASAAGDVVTFTAPAASGHGMVARGSRITEGTPLLPSGSILDARAIGLLAEMGLDKVMVRPKPRLVLASVASALIAPGQPLTAVTQRYAAAPALVAAAARADGATVYPLDSLGDDRDSIGRALADQVIRADLMVVLTDDEAGVRFVADVLARQGRVTASIVDLENGTPVALGRLGDDRVPVLVLPASPVRALSCYFLFVRPLVDELRAHPGFGRSASEATLAATVPTPSSGGRFVPVRVAEGRAYPVASEGDDLALDLYRADALALVPAGGGAAGARVACLPLSAAE